MYGHHVVPLSDGSCTRPLLQRLKIPAGLDLGAHRGDEIALAILAEIVQLGRSEHWTAAREAETAEASCCGGGAVVEELATAVDPVCGMTVATGGERPRLEHGGEVYHFCCGGCLQTFSAELRTPRTEVRGYPRPSLRDEEAGGMPAQGAARPGAAHRLGAQASRLLWPAERASSSRRDGRM